MNEKKIAIAEAAIRWRKAGLAFGFGNKVTEKQYAESLHTLAEIIDQYLEDKSYDSYRTETAQ